MLTFKSVICKNETCGKEFDEKISWQKFCERSCYNQYWGRYYKEKKQHKIDELSSEIERLKKKLSKKNSDSKL